MVNAYAGEKVSIISPWSLQFSRNREVQGLCAYIEGNAIEFDSSG
jgi:hypothetical protein